MDNDQMMQQQEEEENEAISNLMQKNQNQFNQMQEQHNPFFDAKGPIVNSVLTPTIPFVPTQSEKKYPGTKPRPKKHFNENMSTKSGVENLVHSSQFHSQNSEYKPEDDSDFQDMN